MTRSDFLLAALFLLPVLLFPGALMLSTGALAASVAVFVLATAVVFCFLPSASPANKKSAAEAKKRN
ncbi:MAG: hypothetical protein CMJ58_25405 [Planctomycetaceae bacterium]|nr:hypothetical protein [Planctomycetaceae bacterium]